MTNVKRNLLVTSASLAVLLGGAYYYVSKQSKESSPTQVTPAPVASTTDLGNGLSVANTGGATIEMVQTIPPTLGTIKIVADLSPEAKTILRNRIEAQYEILRKEPNRVDIWLQLGVNRKISGDFAGAVEAWNYVVEVSPSDMRATAYGNLGDLYMYFLKDFAKAETNYTQAIALNPKVMEYYRALFYLYRDIYKNAAKAEEIRTLAAKNNPGQPDITKL